MSRAEHPLWPPAHRPVPRHGTLRAVGVGLLPALVLLALGAVQLSRHLALWYDEDYTLLAVRTPLPQLLAAVRSASPLVSWLTVAPSFNAPYYVLMHGWCALSGTSALALRLPSLLCAAGAVAVVALLTRRLCGGGPRGDLAGITAGLLAATGPLLAQQAVEARSYGAAELATAVFALALVRRTDAEGGLLPLGLAAAAAGLLHWFTLPVLAGSVLALLATRGRRAAPEALVVGLACLPALALVALQITGGGDGTPITQQVGAALPARALADWSAGAWGLSAVLVLAFTVALVRTPHRRLLLGWTVVPLALMTALELARPVYFGRYALFALLGLVVGAALAAASLPARWRAAVSAVLVALSLLVCLPRLQAEAREHPEQVVALLEAEQSAGQPVAAADGRAALELVEEVAQEGSRLQADLLLRPEHVPADGSATVAWLVRSGSGSAVPASPNDAWLVTGGWQLTSTQVVQGEYGDLTVQQWTR